MTQPLTLRKLKERLGDDWDKYQDVPLTLGLRDPHANFEIIVVADDWPQRVDPRPADGVNDAFSGQMRFVAYADFAFRKIKKSA